MSPSLVRRQRNDEMDPHHLLKGGSTSEAPLMIPTTVTCALRRMKMRLRMSWEQRWGLSQLLVGPCWLFFHCPTALGSRSVAKPATRALPCHCARRCSCSARLILVFHRVTATHPLTLPPTAFWWVANIPADYVARQPFVLERHFHVAHASHAFVALAKPWAVRHDFPRRACGKQENKIKKKRACVHMVGESESEMGCVVWMGGHGEG